MNNVIKILLSIVLFIIGILCAGLWPYITVLPSMGLFIAAILGIRAIWQTKPVEGEGEIFKNKDKLDKD